MGKLCGKPFLPHVSLTCTKFPSKRIMQSGVLDLQPLGCLYPGIAMKMAHF